MDTTENAVKECDDSHATVESNNVSIHDASGDGSSAEKVDSIPSEIEIKTNSNSGNNEETKSLSKSEENTPTQAETIPAKGIEPETISDVIQAKSVDGEMTKPTDSNGSLSSVTPSTTTSIHEVNTMTARQYATVISLCFMNLLKYMDRFTIAGILPQIQCAFGINDAQGGLLSTAFIVSYMFFSPLFGYLGDRFSRRLIMGIGISFWSLSSLAGSFTETYGLFLTSRILVGIGEAMFSTVSPTIISDVCVGDLRSKFLILYYFAIPVGSGLGFVVGAAMASAFGSWEWGLRLTPILGAIAVLLLIFVVQEPPRGIAEGSTLSPTSYFDDLKYLAKNKSYVWSTAGVTLVTYVSGALAWWGPKFITLGLATTQGQDVSYGRVSLIVGFEAALAGVVGVASGSLLGQKLRKINPTADALVCAWSMVICAPLLYWGIYIADGPAVPTYIILFFGQWFLNVNWAPAGDILLYVVVPTRRSTAEAFSILITHALGDAGSPYITGVISDSFKESLGGSSVKALQHVAYDAASILKESGSDDECTGSSFINPDTVLVDFHALQYSLFLTTIIAALSAFFFFANAWYIVDDKAKVAKEVKEHAEAERLCKLEQQITSEVTSESDHSKPEVA